MLTAAKNSDGSIAVVVLNQTEKGKTFELKLGDSTKKISISPHALQTILIE